MIHRIKIEARLLDLRGKLVKYLVSAFLGLALVSPSFAQHDDTDVEEIIVIGELTKSAAEEQIIAVEDELYRMFNEKNGDSKLNMECYRVTPTGSHFSHRLCEPRFLTRARQDNIKDYASGVGVLLTPDALQQQVKDDMDKVNAVYTRLLKEDPIFAEVAAILAALRARLAQLNN
jgi:hypothetical protein